MSNMSKVPKGRPWNKELVSTGEVMEWLSVTKSTLRQLRKDRVLEPVTYHQRVYWYDAGEVRAALSVLRGKQTVDAHSRNSLLALTTAKRCERKLNMLLELQGIAPLAPLDAQAMYLRALAWLRTPPREVTHKLLLTWARELMGVDTHAIRAIASTYGGLHPWMTFLHVAHVLLQAPKQPALLYRTAWDVLHLARNRLREEAYLYCRSITSPSEARRLVPDHRYDHINDIILAMLE